MSTKQDYLTVAKKHYPDLSDDDIATLLWSATCFPFGDADMVEKQLADMKEHTDGSLDQAMARADQQMDEAMAKHRETTQPDSV